MQTHRVLVTCDVTAQVSGNPFRYRVYVNNELFVERTWIWKNVYLEENILIDAPVGIYPIRFETVDPENGTIEIRNYRILHGSAGMITHQAELCLEITE